MRFRGMLTATLSGNAVVADVQGALEALATIGDVRVAFATPGGDGTSPSVCTAGGQTWHVTFLSEFGDVPELRVDIDGAEVPPTPITLTVVEHQRGTKEDIECSGRGICNYDEGTCACFQGMGSSDGFNRPGERRDCGYIIEETYFATPG